MDQSNIKRFHEVVKHEQSRVKNRFNIKKRFKESWRWYGWGTECEEDTLAKEKKMCKGSLREKNWLDMIRTDYRGSCSVLERIMWNWYGEGQEAVMFFGPWSDMLQVIFRKVRKNCKIQENWNQQDHLVRSWLGPWLRSLYFYNMTIYYNC